MPHLFPPPHNAGEIESSSNKPPPPAPGYLGIAIMCMQTEAANCSRNPSPMKAASED